MEVFGHVTTFYHALRMAGLGERGAEELVLKHSAKLCLTDAIRWTVRPTSNSGEHPVVRFGRGYSHFTDGCWIKLPYGDALKTFTNIHQTEFFAPGEYRFKFADQPTDFSLFLRHNPEMFYPENEIWGLAALAHLQQDVSSDTMWQHNLCRCNTDQNRVHYVRSGRTVTGEKFREDMKLANIIVHRKFVRKIFIETGTVIDQDWLELACRSFYNHYDSGMAENTCGYLNMDERVFLRDPEPEGEIFETLIQNGLISQPDDLFGEINSMFSNSVGCFNILINKLVR